MVSDGLRGFLQTSGDVQKNRCVSVDWREGAPGSCVSGELHQRRPSTAGETTQGTTKIHANTSRFE